MKQLPFIILCAFLFLVACKKSSTPSANCYAIKQAVLENNIHFMKAAINKICESIAVIRTANDPDGLKHSLNELVKTINNSCGIQALSLCYFCIDTLPGQSEIRVTVNAVSRILDISYNNNKQLIFVNMHD